MTYREALQIQIKALQDIYDNAEGLRDCATSEGKEAFNYLRRNLPKMWELLQKEDNTMHETFAFYQCKGDYSITVTPKNV